MTMGIQDHQQPITEPNTEDHHHNTSNNSPASTMMTIKGKRTKRQRPPPASPLTLTIACAHDLPDAAEVDQDPDPTTTSRHSSETDQSTREEEEEEDMANCLMLLARGHIGFNATTTTTNAPFAFRCKTCDRSFPSFQALGGHRASHKKPRLNNNNDADRLNDTSTALSLQIMPSPTMIRCTTNSKPQSHESNNSVTIKKVHECSICGAEFNSGQALGGHMRRHRTVTSMPAATPRASPTTGASFMSSGPAPEPDDQSNEKAEMQRHGGHGLDLNLPPATEERESKYGFASTEQVLVFSTSTPLVHCHY